MRKGCWNRDNGISACEQPNRVSFIALKRRDEPSASEQAGSENHINLQSEEKMKNNRLEDLSRMFQEIGHQLGQAIGESMVEAVRLNIPRLRDELGIVSTGIGRRTSPAARSAKVSASLTRPCPVPDCNRPGRGPRFSFLCEIHRDMPKHEREKYRVRPKA